MNLKMSDTAIHRGKMGPAKEIATRDALLDRVLTAAKKDLTIQRTKVWEK